MECKEFREKHVAFVDDLLSLAEQAAMLGHLRRCVRCSRHDTCVRRGLLVARNLPQIQPSADFMARLNARLHDAECGDGACAFLDRPQHKLPLARFAVLAAGIIGAVTLAASRLDDGPPEPVRLAPVVASIPAPEPEPLASPAVMASLATGIPVWPAVFMAGAAPAHMVRVELRETR